MVQFGVPNCPPVHTGLCRPMISGREMGRIGLEESNNVTKKLCSGDSKISVRKIDKPFSLCYNS